MDGAGLSDRALLDRVIRLHVERATVVFQPAAALGITQTMCIEARKKLDRKAAHAKRELLNRLAEVRGRPGETAPGSRGLRGELG